METLVQSVQKVKEHATEKAKTVEPVRYGSLSVGDHHWQGDVCLIKLAELPREVVPDSNPQQQLAPGNTQGSRHCLDSMNRIKLFRKKEATELDGPIIQSEREFTVTHPEHGHVTVPAGVYGIQYQRQFSKDEEFKRVID